MSRDILPPIPRSQFSAADLALLAQYPNVPIVDGSSIDAWKRCRRLSHFTNHAPFGLGLRPAQSALPLEFGAIFHTTLDLVYSAQPPRYGQAAVWFRQLFNERIAQIVAALKPFPGEVSRLEEARDLGVAMLSEWAAWAPPRDDFEVVATEAPMLVPIRADVRVSKRYDASLCDRGSDVIALYYMRLDGLVRDNRGRLWLREYKTASRWWPGYYVDLAQQLTRYCWGIKQRLGAAPVGVLMDVFLKQAVADPPLLKRSGLPTTSMAKLAYVTFERYQRAIMQSGMSPTEAHMEALSDLFVRDAEAHPTLRRILAERTPYAIEEAGRRLSREVVKMLNSVGDLDPTEDIVHCGFCPVQKLCRLMEDGDEWEGLAEAMYEPGKAMWQDDLEASQCGK